ncbi:hypothetical protein EDD21DRAFT_414755 [Dissophora ornata]|nr:hypothetical protein BGZ58_007337 [Dissophora ornata]KAI8601617.1 hypothetical protein EDD21DRAFT_414755 [Dissophora ornata]
METTVAETSTSVESDSVNTATAAPKSLSDLPLEILCYIALILPSREFSRLLQTCRLLYDALNSHWIWQQRFVSRFGMGRLPSSTESETFASGEDAGISGTQIAPGPDENSQLNSVGDISMQELIRLYRHYMRMVIPAQDLGIVHGDNDSYWKIIKRSDSIYGRMAGLLHVWWLDVSAVFYGVPRGRYRIQWRFEMGNSTPIINTEFRAVAVDKKEIPSWDTSHPSATSFTCTGKEQLVEPTTSSSEDGRAVRGPVMVQVPGVLIINGDHPNVLVQFRNHRGTYKYGLSVDFVRLIDEDDPRVWVHPATAETHESDCTDISEDDSDYTEFSEDDS